MDGFYPPQEFAPEFGPYGDLEGECVQEFPTEYGPYVGNGGYHTSEAAYLESQMGATPREAQANVGGAPKKDEQQAWLTAVAKLELEFLDSPETYELALKVINSMRSHGYLPPV